MSGYNSSYASFSYASHSSQVDALYDYGHHIEKDRTEIAREKLNEVDNSIQKRLKAVDLILAKAKKSSIQQEKGPANLKVDGCKFVRPILVALSKGLKNPNLTANKYWLLQLNPLHEEKVDQSSKKLIKYINDKILPLIDLALKDEISPKHLKELNDKCNEMLQEEPLFIKMAEKQEEPTLKLEDAKNLTSTILLIIAYAVFKVFYLFNALFNFCFAAFRCCINPSNAALAHYQFLMQAIREKTRQTRDENLGKRLDNEENRTDILESKTDALAGVIEASHIAIEQRHTQTAQITLHNTEKLVAINNKTDALENKTSAIEASYIAIEQKQTQTAQLALNNAEQLERLNQRMNLEKSHRNEKYIQSEELATKNKQLEQENARWKVKYRQLQIASASAARVIDRFKPMLARNHNSLLNIPLTSIYARSSGIQSAFFYLNKRLAIYEHSAAKRISRAEDAFIERRNQAVQKFIQRSVFKEFCSKLSPLFREKSSVSHRETHTYSLNSFSMSSMPVTAVTI